MILAPAGVLAPSSKADLAFTLHMLSWLAITGTAAIVEFPGVLYRGGKEQKIRQYLTDNNFVDTIIQLPDNMFFGTGIATCIIVLKKSKKDNNILFIDATNEYNLSVSSYVEQQDTKEVIDIRVLNQELEEIVAKENDLRTQIDAIVADLEGNSIMEKEFNFLVYNAPDNDIKVNAIIKNETIWLTQKFMADLFGVHPPAISKHLKNIFDKGELKEVATVSKMEIVQFEGNRQITR